MSTGAVRNTDSRVGVREREQTVLVGHESEFEQFVEGDTQSVQEVVVDILADTTFRLVHVMENAGGLPRELSLEPPDPSPVRRRTRILRQRPRPPPQEG